MDPRDFIPQAPSYFPPLPAGYEAAEVKLAMTRNVLFLALPGDAPAFVLVGDQWVRYAEWEADQ